MGIMASLFTLVFFALVPHRLFASAAFSIIVFVLSLGILYLGTEGGTDTFF